MTATELLTLGLTNAVLATVLAVCGWLLTRVWKNPHVASVVWLVVLLKLVTPPIVTLPIEWSEQSVPAGDAGSDVAKVAQETNALTFEPIAVESSFENDPFAEGSNAQMQLGAEFEQAADDAAGYPLTPRPSPEGEGSEFVGKAVPMGDVASSRVEDATLGVEAGLVLPTVADEAVAADLSPVVGLKAAVQKRGWPLGRIYELVAPLLLAVWLIGSLVVGGVTVRRAFTFRKLLRVAAVNDGEIAAVAGDVAGRMGLRRRPDVRSASTNVGPLVWAGGIRPTIVVPRPLWDSIGEAEREILLAHELAHVARRDHWVRRVEAVVLALYWWLPTAWIAVRRREVAAELCCDALVLKTYPDRPRAYAEVLFHAVSQFSASRPVVLASGLGRISELKERLAMIVHDRIPKRPRMLTRLGLLVMGGAALFVSAQFVKADPQERADSTAGSFADTPNEKGVNASPFATERDALPNPFGSGISVPPYNEADPFGNQSDIPGVAQADPFGGAPEEGVSPSSSSFRPDEILFFSAAWDVRGQQVVKPVIEKLRKEGLRFQEIDIDKDAETARGYGVTSVPTFIAVKKLLKEDRQTEVKIRLDELVGVQTEDALREFATRRVPYKSGAGRDKTLESLRKIIASKDEPAAVKVQAIRSYGRLARGSGEREAAAEKVLVEVAKSAESDQLKLAAAEALQTIGSSKGIEMMWSLLERSEDPETLRAVVVTLEKAEAVPPTVESVVAVVTRQAAGLIEGGGAMGMGGGFGPRTSSAGELLARLGESAEGIRRLVEAIETIKVDGGMEGGYGEGMALEGGWGYGMGLPGMAGGGMGGFALPNPREALLAVLRAVKPETDEITDALVEALSSKDAGVRAAAAQALGNPVEPKEATPAMSSPVQQRAPTVMPGASGAPAPAATVRGRGGASGVPVQSPAETQGSNPFQRAPTNAAPESPVISDKVRAELIKSLSAAAQDEKATPETRAAALESLAKIAEGTNHASEVADLAKRKFEGATNAIEREAATVALSRLGDPAGVEAIWKTLAMSAPSDSAGIVERLAAVETYVPATAEGIVVLAGFVARNDRELARPPGLMGPPISSLDPIRASANQDPLKMREMGRDILKRVLQDGQGVKRFIEASESLKDAAEGRVAGLSDLDLTIELKAREILLQLLKSAKPTSDDVAKALAEGLSSEDSDVRKAAAEALGNAAEKAPKKPDDAQLASQEVRPTGDSSSVEVKGRAVRFQYDKYLLIKHDDKITALQLQLDPRYGWDGVTYRWYRVTNGTDQFFRTSPEDSDETRNPHLETDRGETIEGDQGTGVIAAGPLEIKWSKSDLHQGWLYLGDAAEFIQVYPEQFDRIEDFSGKLDSTRWSRVR